MRVEIFAALIGVIGTVVGTLGGVFLGSYLSRRAARDLFADQAKAEFSAAFTDTLVKLNRRADQDGGVNNILKGDFLKQLAAYLKLRFILSQEHRATVEQAWREYVGPNEGDDHEERDFYLFAWAVEPKDVEHQYLLAIKRITALLEKVSAQA